MVRKHKGKYQLISRKGKVLGTHPSRKKALAQEQAIEISKHKKKKR